MKEVPEEKKVSISTKSMMIIAIAILVIGLVVNFINFILGFVDSYGVMYKLFSNISMRANSICNFVYMGALIYGLSQIIKMLYDMKTKKDN